MIFNKSRIWHPRHLHVSVYRNLVKRVAVVEAAAAALFTEKLRTVVFSKVIYLNGT